MKIDEQSQVKEFMEKPKPDMNIDAWKIPAEARGALPPEKEYLASMGIYIFNANTMEECLLGENEKYTDFGKEILPLAIGKKKICSYVFDGYWEDIGTIRSFYEANIQLTELSPAFDFYANNSPIYTHMRNLPPSKINKADITSSLTSEGCIITDCKLNKSVIGVRSIIEKGTELDGVIMMGADYYDDDDEKADYIAKGKPVTGIGKNCKIANTIIDKNARIGDNCQIGVSGKKYEDGDHGSFYSADGIIVIRKGAVIPSGTVI